ncbi:MAG: S1/P1 nuclease [Bacteroidia bacterium]
MKIKSFLFTFIAIATSLVLLSWGYTGHRTIGVITENHLSPTAKAAVKDLLGDTSIADACTWADDARREPQFANTGNWHFLNLPLGLDNEGFKKYVDTMKSENVYSALINAEKQLTDKAIPKQQKVHALKFLMHFVGDLHQPMHVSRAEDKGGNTIQLNYNEKGTNLHSLWDTRMLESKGLTFDQLAGEFNQIGNDDIKQWQSEPIIQWAWESYQISSELYAEVESMNKRVIDEAYVQKHMPTVKKRMQQAAIRLAGLLNKIYK